MYSCSYLYSLACFRAAQIQCFHRITITKITYAFWNFKNPVIGDWRLPDYTQYKTNILWESYFFDYVALEMVWLKVMQINWGKPDNFEIEISRLF